MANAFIANTPLSHLTEIASNAPGRIIYRRYNTESNTSIMPINQTINYSKPFRSVWMLTCLFTSSAPELMDTTFVYDARSIPTILGIPVTFSIALSGSYTVNSAYKTNYGDYGFKVNFTLDMSSDNSFQFTLNYIVNNKSRYTGILTYAIMVL